MRRALRIIHRVWIVGGATAGAIFIIWSLLAYRATPEAHAALQPDVAVNVLSGADGWRFEPRRPAAPVGVLFFPGALVNPVAYAPLARAVAARGYTVVMVRVPRRGAFGGAQSPEVPARYERALRDAQAAGGPARWIVAGHSLGGLISCRAVQRPRDFVAGLVLIGTSHPRDFSLTHLTIPVTQIYGTRDTVADVNKVEAGRRNLPASVVPIRIDGGNHSQFGYYGFQPGDWPAQISRADQHRLTVEGIVATLERARR